MWEFKKSASHNIAFLFFPTAEVLHYFEPVNELGNT